MIKIQNHSYITFKYSITFVEKVLKYVTNINEQSKKGLILLYFDVQSKCLLNILYLKISKVL